MNILDAYPDVTHSSDLNSNIQECSEPTDLLQVFDSMITLLLVITFATKSIMSGGLAFGMGSNVKAISIVKRSGMSTTKRSGSTVKRNAEACGQTE